MVQVSKVFESKEREIDFYLICSGLMLKTMFKVHILIWMLLTIVFKNDSKLSLE